MITPVEKYPGEDAFECEVGEYGEYVPSPEEIRRQCREIRQSWSEAERRQRASLRNHRWEVPVAKTAQRLSVAHSRE